MTFTFKNTKPISLAVKTPTDQLAFCETCGGINLRAKTSAKIDCPDCNGTGYKNLYYRLPLKASYRPGVQKRWNLQAGAIEYLGECAIKLDARYKEILTDTEWIEMDGVSWKFVTLREPGEALGQHRLVLALSRK